MLMILSSVLTTSITSAWCCLEVGVVWEQGVEVEFLMREGVVDQDDETTTPTCCSVFSYSGIIWERFYCVGGCEVCWMMTTRMLCFWRKSWSCL